jgi:hypothetical protein
MKRFLKGMVNGFIIAIITLLAWAIFFGILTGLYFLAHKTNLPWWSSYGLFFVVIYSVIGGIYEYFKGDK